jgi:predicted Zn-dependent peptidase
MSVAVHTLSNGVRVLSDPMPGLETFALSVVVRGGARWEPKNRSGWCHLLEHMVFKGAAGRTAREIVERLESCGAQINAATGYERTSFQVRGLRGRLPLAMEVVSDLVLRPTLDAVELEREKAVIGQEIAEAYDTPDDHVFDLCQAQAYKGQSLGRPILGSDKSIGVAVHDTLEAWRAALYAPDRIAVSVAGAVDEDETLALAERLFGDAASQPPTDEPEPGSFVGGLATLARSIEQANLVFELPGPGARNPDWFAVRLFAEILGGGMASRLFQEAREKRGLAYAIDAWATSFDETGQLGVYAGASAENAAGLATLVAEEILSLAGHVEEEELSRGKAQLETNLFMAQEQPLARAERSASQLFLFDRVLSADEVRKGVEAVSASDLASAAERMLASKACAAAVLGPRKALPAAGAFQSALFG